MQQHLLELPVMVLAAWGADSDPSGTTVMLFRSEGVGHHTETLDLRDMDAWLTEHHPETYTSTRDDDGRSLLDLLSITPEVLAPCLKYCRAKRSERLAPLVAEYELGCLIDPADRLIDYCRTASPWRQGCLIGPDHDFVGYAGKSKPVVLFDQDK